MGIKHPPIRVVLTKKEKRTMDDTYKAEQFETLTEAALKDIEKYQEFLGDDEFANLCELFEIHLEQAFLAGDPDGGRPLK